jgi:3'(2'), 5'-bisphosphate nucleotidase
MMPSMSFDLQRARQLLPGVIELAVAAGREIMAVYGSDFAVTVKEDRSPLTAADLASQHTIAEGLARLAPDIPMLGEESAAADIAARRSWQTLWLVDPLDGTREFVKRNGEFTVNIALVHEHDALLGVLHAPVTGSSYSAVRGHGAWHVDAHGRQRAIRMQHPAAVPPRVLGSRSHRGRTLDRLLDRLGDHQLLSVGSALKFGWLAEGRADFYVRPGPTSEWDTAAGQIIVEEAGGRVVDFEGRPLRYNARETLTNPSFAAWADDAHDWLALLREA